MIAPPDYGRGFLLSAKGSMKFFRSNPSSSINPVGRFPLRLGDLRVGLNFKLILMIALISLLGMLVSVVLILTLQRQQLIDSALESTTRQSNVISFSLEQAMLRNDRWMIDQIVQTMVGKGSVDHIRILDANSVVRISSSPSEVGGRYSYSDPTCQFCHTGGVRPENRTTIAPTRDNHEALLNVNVIYNEPSCQSCHDAKATVLGITIIEMPLVDLNNQLTAGFWRIVLSALATTALLIGLMILALRRLVIQPVGELTKGMAEVRGGNLDYPLDVTSRDELGDLAESFDATRRQLKAARVENAALFAGTRRREQEAIALHRLMVEISASLETQQVLDAIAHGAREILNADIGVVGLVDEARRAIEVKAYSGARTDLLDGMLIPVETKAAGKLEQPVCIEKWSRDLAIPRAAELIDQENIVSSLAAPMWSKGRLYGYVGILMRRHRRCPKEEVELFTRLALQVVAAIENSELYQQVRHVAVLQERDRLAREMHDNLAQMLGYVNIKASITDDLLAKNQVTQARYSLLELKQVAKDAYTDVREAIFNLRTPMSGGNGLVALLEEYLAEYRAHYGIDANLVIEDGRLARFPAEVEVQVNRIIQEALANVRKHAQAKSAWVRFERASDQVRIRVEDDGIGFDPAVLKRNGAQHFGLQIMRERAESVGGDLEINSRIGAGTQVVLQVAMFPTFEDSHEGS